jgi:hypothetical protein
VALVVDRRLMLRADIQARDTDHANDERGTDDP